MAVNLKQLPRDRNGILKGVWRPVHAKPNFRGQLGAAVFRDGVSRTPVFGKALRVLVALFGKDLYIEPWGAEPTRGVSPPKVFRKPLTADDLAKLEPCPWRCGAALDEADSTAPESAPEAAAEPDAGTEVPEPAGEPESAPAAPVVDGPISAAIADDKAALRGIAEAYGIAVDGRWSLARIRQELEEAGAEFA